MLEISLKNAIQNYVPISCFNEGMAGEIFSEVRSLGPKIVIKNNNPECVLLSPQEYISMLDEIEDMKLMLLAKSRLDKHPDKLISHEEALKILGISQSSLNELEDVEIE